MKLTISKILILLALVLAVPAIGGSAVLAVGPTDPPSGPTVEDPPVTEVAPTSTGPTTPPPAGSTTPTSSTEAAKAAVCDGIALTGGECDPATDKGGLDDIIKQTINVLSIAIGVICVIMIMIGGLKYITSSGDANSLSSAKNTILYALVGLVVVALAQTIVRFVLSWL